MNLFYEIYNSTCEYFGCRSRTRVSRRAKSDCTNSKPDCPAEMFKSLQPGSANNSISYNRFFSKRKRVAVRERVRQIAEGDSDTDSQEMMPVRSTDGDRMLRFAVTEFTVQAVSTAQQFQSSCDKNVSCFKISRQCYSNASSARGIFSTIGTRGFTTVCA